MLVLAGRPLAGVPAWAQTAVAVPDLAAWLGRTVTTVRAEIEARRGGRATWPRSWRSGRRAPLTDAMRESLPALRATSAALSRDHVGPSLRVRASPCCFR
jgi:hypothetical protein